MGIESTFVSGWKVQRRSEVNNAGVVEVSWSDHLDIDAHVRQLSGFEITSRQSESNEATHRVYTDGGLDIKSSDRFVGPDGKIYNIENPNNPHDLDHHIEFDVTRGIEQQEQE